MSGPRTLTATIRKIHGRELSKERNRRARARRREGYARTGPVDIPPEIVWAMVERGILASDDVTWDDMDEGTAEGTPHVDPKVLNRAMCRLLDLIADRPTEFLEFLQDDFSDQDNGERQITSIAFQQEIGLLQAPAMRHEKVLGAIDRHGYKYTITKKSLSDP